jgi:2-polyprenyl-3-methyl-5-hydroxy-6-metoxy-1,4-benzoquinol methylase
MAGTKWIACNACGADDRVEIGAVGKWSIGRCRCCNLVYVNPVPIFDPGPAFSELSLEFQYTRFQREVTPAVLRHDEDQFRVQAERAWRIAGRPGRRAGRFLDVGCGSGATVHVAATLGWDALGVELDPALVDIGRRQLGANVRCGTLPDPTLEGDRYDFVRLRDVIEHLPNPYDVLVDIRRLLAPGGAVLIATPNDEGLPTQLRYAALGRRDTVATVNPPHHLHGFTPATLRRILLRAGLHVVELGTTTPVDPRYVTSRNMRESRDRLKVLAWSVAKRIGVGSMLVAWARRVDA